ncbi:MAG: methyltransferase domain-containing protein [Acidobacteriota bacterium]|nr:methyltransferase domain-containing protein [Acidobacteriota bacterium]
MDSAAELYLGDFRLVDDLRGQIARHRDPLGDALMTLRTAEDRRKQGATYTPARIVEAMVAWAADFRKAANLIEPRRIVDPGVGSGRFLLAAARKFPNAELIGVDIDPLAVLITRANLNTAGYANRSRVSVGDYRELKLPALDGRTLYIGNPPYVRHHLLSPKWKQWLTASASTLGYEASQLAGLHVHFFLATALHAKAGDFGAFITAAEWLDVNYGKLVRKLFLNELGGQSLTIVEPAARPFADAASTALISTFEIGAAPGSIRIRRVGHVNEIGPLRKGRVLERNLFEKHIRWSGLSRRFEPKPAGFVELGELCRVHRGQVTGANRVWIAGKHAQGLPSSALFRTVTKARELFDAGRVLADCSTLREVIDLPVDLSMFDVEERRAVNRFLRLAKAAGASAGYVAVNRKAWWSVGLKSPAPILATYMARRPPAFVRNLAGARHINIAHGIYPRDPLAPELLDRLAGYLAKATRVQDGRTYAGGLTKFEPREMERLLVPTPEMLRESDA